MINAIPRIAIAVNDYAAAMETFRTTFGLPTVDFSDVTVPGLGAHVGLCVPERGSNIEIMAPATPGLPLAESLQRFLARRGDGLYALMLEAADPDEEADELTARGLTVLPLMKGAGGRDVHPSSTEGVLIRVYPDNSVGDRGNPADRRSRSPHLSGITRAILATDDLDRAIDVYGRGLGLAATAASDDDDRGVRLAHCSAPTGGAVELVSVTDRSRPFAAAVDRFLTGGGRGLYALVLESGDADAAMAALTGADDPAVAATGPAEVTAFGTRFLIV